MIPWIGRHFRRPPPPPPAPDVAAAAREREIAALRAAVAREEARLRLLQHQIQVLRLARAPKGHPRP